MSDFNSWEDDPSAQDDNLSRQAQNLNINNTAPDPGANSFRPNANAFQPGVQSFQPGQQYYQHGPMGQQQYMPPQYGGAYPQYGQGGYGQYNQAYGGQYGQGGYNNAYTQPYGGHNQQQQQQQPFQPQAQQPQQRQTPVIAKRPAGNAQGPQNQSTSSLQRQDGAGAGKGASNFKAEAGAKVLSIGGDAPKPKVLSISSQTQPAAAAQSKQAVERKEPPTAEEGAKITAARAVEKTEKPSDKAAASADSAPAPSSGKSSPAPGDSKPGAREVDAVIKDQAADVDAETLEEIYGKEHVNLIFIGHVDAGKSTLGGSILYATGMVDERTMDKYKREAKEAGRETWYLSWALDLTKEERAKGKTVEVGRGFFETEKRRYTILDAPGHKTFVPNMIGGASQADVGILVISARKGEYETGFEKGGQTREHAMLAKTQGVNKLIVVVNKMDDPTVEWSKERYDECTTKLKSFLRSTGYDPKNGMSRRVSRSHAGAYPLTDLTFMPISAQTAVGIKDRVPKKLAPWYDGPSLLEYLDSMKTLERKVNAPFMMPVNGKYRVRPLLPTIRQPSNVTTGHGHHSRRQDRVRRPQKGPAVRDDAEPRKDRHRGAVRRDGRRNLRGVVRRPGADPAARDRGGGCAAGLRAVLAQAAGALRDGV